MATKPTKKTTTKKVPAKKPVKKPPKKVVKQHTIADKNDAYFRCKSGEPHKVVAADYGVTSITMDRWVTRWKPVSNELLLEMLRAKLALHLSASGAILPASIASTVAGLKMIFEQGSQSETQETLDKILELGTRVYKMMKGEDGVE